MKYCRFLFENEPLYGRIEVRAGAPWIVDLVAAPEEDLAFRLQRARAETTRPVVKDLAAFDFEPIPLDNARLLAPVTPSKIVCVGRNYREHAQELGNDIPAEPLLFLKPPSSLLQPGGLVRIPKVSQRVDYEGELALVIGKQATKLKEGTNWRAYVRGYTLANDVTARDLQKKDGQWTRAKGFDTFCPVGPLVSDEVDPQSGITIETRVNSQVRQTGSTKDFIFDVPNLLFYITAAITLEPGDVVLTGTPSGVGPLQPGDRTEVAAEGLGVLRNSFAPEEI